MHNIWKKKANVWDDPLPVVFFYSLPPIVTDEQVAARRTSLSGGRGIRFLFNRRLALVGIILNQNLSFFFFSDPSVSSSTVVGKKWENLISLFGALFSKVLGPTSFA